jgi:murein DD-endopeptidase MepM/ murein hydrolase activator NlpD
VTNPRPQDQRGYGNIYTPHAGSMIIQVQREGGLANRTIILGTNQVRLLRFFMSRVGKGVLILLGASWIFFGYQTTRVPLLTSKLRHMERDALRLDTLQRTLVQLQRQYDQVQLMLGARAGAGTSADDPDLIELTVPRVWPLAGPGYITRGMTDPNDFSDAHPGLDVAAEIGTEVRAAGGGVVVEVKEDEEYGLAVRLAHLDGYETLYAHTSKVLVQEGDRVPAGATIALSGNSGRSTAPHLHFEVRRAGKMLDPMQLISKDSRNGNLR